ncbi:MAG: cytochrome c family protein [Pseudomonadales bacterium]
MKIITIVAAIAASTVALPAFSQADASAGADGFKKCKACHTIQNGDELIVRGGRTGPNLYGVIGRQAGTYEGFNYSDSMIAAGEAGLVWDEEKLATFISDPRAFLREYLDDDSARSKMSFRLREGGEDMAAYLATFSEAAEDESESETAN